MTARRSLFRRAGTAGPILAALVMAGCSSGAPQLSGASFEMPATAVSYEAEINGMPTDEMTDLAEESLSIFREQDRGAQSLAFLRRRAENDIATVKKILSSRGYFDGSAKATVEEIPASEASATTKFELPSLSDLEFWKEKPETLTGEPKQYARVVIDVDPGRQFTLVRHDFHITDPAAGAVVPPPALLGSPVGGPALAVPIVGAEAAAVTMLQSNGYPYADKVDRKAVADLAKATLEVDSQLKSGPESVYGPVLFKGLEDVRESYLRTYIPWKPGAPVDRKEIQGFQKALLSTNLFDTALVELPKNPPVAAGPVALPVTVTADERPFRTIAFGARYATDTGPSGTARFEHRNLWGANETLAVEAELGTSLQRLGLGYTKPQYLRPGQDLVGTLELRHEETDAFDETRATLTGGLKRKLSRYWTGGLSGLLEASRTSQIALDQDAYLAGIPAYAEYNDTDDLLNPTSGTRFRAEITPFAGFLDDEPTAFLTLDNKISGYWDILDNDKYVLAGRARVASIVASDIDKVPINRRLYAGGGGSVRGYDYQSIGPRNSYGLVVGGERLLVGSATIEHYFTRDWGIAAFVDSGDAFDGTDFHARTGAGLGLRWRSPVGMVRVDLGVPVNNPYHHGVQLHIVIGPDL